MDARNVRVLRPYEEAEDDTIYVDDNARVYLGSLEWGSEVLVIGRRRHRAVIKPLKEFDADGQIARMKESLRNKLMIEWGEEVLLQKL